MKNSVDISTHHFLVFLLIFGGFCGLGGALILAPTVCPSIAPTTHYQD